MNLRKATASDTSIIWEILQQAIEQRKKDGSNQWQDGYPNEQTVVEDISKDWGYVIDVDGAVIAYAAIIFGVEPAYNYIVGQWLTDGDYVAVHRVATANSVKGQGVATSLFMMLEELSIAHNVYSIKVDTNYDNIPMLKILAKLGYHYCGEVYFRGGARRAYEKRLGEK